MNGKVGSPCTSICTYDETNTVCLGCGRTVEEVGDWFTVSDEVRKARMEEIARARLEWIKNGTKRIH